MIHNKSLVLMNPPTETSSGAKTDGEKTSSGIDFDDLGKRISRGFDQVKQVRDIAASMDFTLTRN